MSDEHCQKLVNNTIGKLSYLKCDCKEPGNGCRLGQGGFGDVYLGKYEGNIKVAVKRVLKTRTKVEEEILRKVDIHDNILRYYITEEDQNL